MWFSQQLVCFCSEQHIPLDSTFGIEQHHSAVAWLQYYSSTVICIKQLTAQDTSHARILGTHVQTWLSDKGSLSMGHFGPASLKHWQFKATLSTKEASDDYQEKVKHLNRDISGLQASKHNSCHHLSQSKTNRQFLENVNAIYRWSLSSWRCERLVS